MSHVYQSFVPALESLLSYFVKDPSQINSKVRKVELSEDQTCIVLLPGHLDSVLKNPNQGIDVVTIRMHAFILKLCQFYLLGLETKFGICGNCNFVEIDYKILKLCGCDPQLTEDLRQLKLLFDERERIKESMRVAQKQPLVVKEPYAIWDKLEGLVRIYCHRNSSTILEITVYYKTKLHKPMWDYYDELTELILSETECKNNSVKKSLKYDGSNVCYFVLAEIKSSKKDLIELKASSSLIPLYFIVFKP